MLVRATLLVAGAAAVCVTGCLTAGAGGTAKGGAAGLVAGGVATMTVVSFGLWWTNEVSRSHSDGWLTGLGVVVPTASCMPLVQLVQVG